MAVRGSISSSVLRSSNGTSRQRIPDAMRWLSASVRRPGRAVTSARTRSATSATSPCTPRSTGRWRPGAVGSRSTCTTVAPGPTSARWRVVHMFRAQPHPTTRSDASISSAASGDAKPPDTSSDHGLPANRPLATALVASSAPVCPASSSSSRRAPRAPRPATNTGASAASSSAAKRSISPSAMLRTGPPEAGTAPTSCTSSACTERGRLSTTVRRSDRAARTASTAAACAPAGSSTVTVSAPTARASAAWST